MRRLFAALHVLFQVRDSPHRVALAFGIGIFIAFSPLLGIHTALALGVAFFFRLNKVALLVGAYVNNPWTLAPMFMAGTGLGCALLGVAPDGLVAIDWTLEGRAFYSALAVQLRPYLWPFVIGNTVAGVLGGVVGYVILRRVIERRTRRAGEAAVEA